MEEEPQTPIGRVDARIEAETVKYTSLRDVLPPSLTSPTSAVQEAIGGGRRRIGSSGGASTIRNPLVMLAALAYLHPVGVGGGDRRFFGGLGSRMGWDEHGCFNGVVLALLRRVFGERKGGADDDDDDDEDEF